jgi:hypothetical protein
MITFSKIGTYGRLGNQLFQYAAAKTAANNVSAVFAIPSENQVISKYFNLSCKFYSLEKNSSIIDKMSRYNETVFNYDSRFENIKDNTDLLGYFQTEKYFSNICNIIKNDFKFKEEIKIRCEEKFNSYKLNDSNIVSLHVRRTDYINLQNYHPLCTEEYYNESQKYFKNFKFIIFSDDIEWCKTKFVGDQYIYSDNSNDIDDLYMMTICDGNIIANSSFSWWGAWLNKNKDNLVLSPKTWFGKNYSDKNTEDIYCKNWIKI